MPMWTPRLAATAEPLFRALVQAIADDIGGGTLRPGDRLPPHRDIADGLGVARGTVARAYREAEKVGLVRSEVGRGTSVLAPDAGARPYASLLEAPTVLCDLSTNVPLVGIDPDPADVLRRLADRPDRRSLLRYQPPNGVRRHRVAGAAWLERMGIQVDPDRVLLASGAQHALFVVFSALGPRAPVVYVEELTYPGMHAIAEALRLKLVPIALDEEGMSPDALERAVRRFGPGAAYFMPTIHNPTGAVASDERRERIASIARRTNLFLVEDAANRMLAVRRPRALHHFAPERTFVVASVSKVLAPGLRVAFVVAPESEMPALTRLVWASQWMGCPIGAEIVAMWLEEGIVDEALTKKRREATRRQALARRVFQRRKVHAHSNALHLWLELPRDWAAGELAAEAAKKGIVVTPSTAFWARATRAPGAVRIALGGVESLAELRRGLERLAVLL